jgi:uncharacterized protein (TIGR02466 family)
MKNIQILFPKTFYMVNDFMSDSLPSFEARIKEIAENFKLLDMKQFNVKTSNLTYNKLYQEELFKKFAENVLGHCKEYMSQIGWLYLFELCEYKKMWFNISRLPNGQNFPHTHRNSLISGVYYVKSSEEDNIVFYDNIHSVMPESRDPYKPLGKTMHEVACLPGRLILFKSDFVHANFDQKSEEKIIISFNIGHSKLNDESLEVLV